jgi:predicted RNase H-like nuclease (RuvC/YqgF family)
MIKPVSAVTEAALRNAMDRLIAGRPVKTDGRLTIANLAAEAGISRATVYRAPAIVHAFEAAATARGRRSQTRGAKTIAALKAELTTLQGRERAELRELRAMNHVMAQRIQALTLLTVEQKRQIAALHEELSRPERRGTVVALGKGAGV